MEESDFGLDDDSGTRDQKQTNPQESKLLSIRRCIKYLTHACQCKDASCSLSSCQKMKRVVQHAKSCKQKTNGGCPICKQLIALCCYHAKHCQKSRCLVPFCVSIKNKLRQQQLTERGLQAQILQHRVKLMQQQAQILKSNAIMQNHDMPGSVLQPSPENLNSSSQQKPMQAWQQLLQTLKSPVSTAQQEQQVLTILKANPQLMSAFIKERSAHQQQLQQHKLQHQQQPPQHQHYLDTQRQQQQPNQLAHSSQQVQVPVSDVVIPEITKPAPNFEDIAFVNGAFKNIKLSDYKGKYLILFFYPFVPSFVCPDEIIAFSEKIEEFKKINCEVIGCSTGSRFSDLSWMNFSQEGGLRMMNIPLLADESCKISKDYGVVCKENESLCFRGLFIIDAVGILRQITISDLPFDKSVDETLHFVKAFQHIDQYV